MIENLYLAIWLLATVAAAALMLALSLALETKFYRQKCAELAKNRKPACTKLVPIIVPYNADMARKSHLN